MADLLGWIGAALVLGAYGLVQFRVLKPESLLWIAMNIVGSLALATSAAIDRRWPFVVLNAVWSLIGLTALVRRPHPVIEIEG